MRPTKEKKTTRITIDLTPALYERLNKMEEFVEAASKADVVRDALRLYEYFTKKAAEGYEFSIERKGEKPQKVVLFDMGSR